MTKIQLSREIVSRLLHFAQQSPEFEICGLIGSKNNLPSNFYPIDNAAEDPKTQFLFDTKQQIAAFKKMRSNKETLWAIYHSHPTATAYPSKMDLNMATYENVLYFIISLNIKGVLELRAFRIHNKNVSELKITL